jgi:hypothetical protein
VPRFILRPASLVSLATVAMGSIVVLFIGVAEARAAAAAESPAPEGASEPLEGAAPESPALQVVPATGPFASPQPSIASPPSAGPAVRPDGPFLLRAIAGAGFSDYEDRSSGDVHMFANGLAAVSGGYAAVQKSQATLDVSLELLMSRSFQGSPGAHAAGDLLAAGLTVSTFLLTSRAEIGLGAYVVRRAGEARDLDLTTGRWTAGVGASLAKYWSMTDGWAWGAGVRVLMLPTRTEVSSDGEKHIHFSDGVGIVALSLIHR